MDNYIKVTDLLADGISLVYGDTIVKDNLKVDLRASYWVGESGISLFKQDNMKHIFDGWYLTKFAERKNYNYKQPTPYWVVIEYAYEDEEGFPYEGKDYAGDIAWGKSYWKNEDDWWKPEYKSLLKHYEQQNNSTPSESDTTQQEVEDIGLELTTGAPIYTKEMFEGGVLPEKGMRVWSYWVEEYLYLRDIKFFRDPDTKVIITLDDNLGGGGMQVPLVDLQFSKPEKTFTEKVIDEITPIWKDTFGEADTYVIQDIYKAFKRIEKELEDD